jgi:nitroreductase
MTAFNPSRRGALVCGGGAALLASTGGALRAFDAAGRPPPADDAYAPWRLWNDPAIAGTPLALVAAGVLAANPHESQPWRFGVSENAIEIFADLSRNLGAMDAYVREMHLGLGCAIENMALAAGPNGYAAELAATPGSLSALDERQAPVLAATLSLTRRELTAPDALYRAIPDRRTNRYAYDRGRAAPQEWREFAARADFGDDVRVLLIEDGEPRRRFDAAVVEATQAIIADKVMIADSDRWFRASSAEIDAHRDGPTLEAAGLSFLTLMAARLFPVSAETSHEAWLRQTRDVQLASAPLVGLIAVRDRYDRLSAIAAGRAWQRLHLSATALGLAMQPLNQPIEMIDRERQAGLGAHWAARMTQITGEDWQATFSFRAGFASEIAPASPRRRLKDVLRE